MNIMHWSNRPDPSCCRLSYAYAYNTNNYMTGPLQRCTDLFKPLLADFKVDVRIKCMSAAAELSRVLFPCLDMVHGSTCTELARAPVHAGLYIATGSYRYKQDKILSAVWIDCLDKSIQEIAS